VVLLQVAGNATGGVGVTTLDGETGATLWTDTYGSGLDDVPRDVARDQRGNILVTVEQNARESGPVGQTRRAQVVSLSAAGNVNWVVGFPTADTTTRTTVAAVAVGVDGDPVVSGHSPAGLDAAVLVMRTLKYDAGALAASAQDGFNAAGDRHVHDDRLAWDHPINELVTGFRLCVDDETGAACQDLGWPDDLTAGITSSTPAGWRTYEIALSKLTSLRPGKRRIQVLAYNDAGSSLSPTLTVLGRSGRQAK
jgi:hypothetical protein